MLIAKVVGNVVSTQKKEGYIGHKLLIVRPIGLDGKLSENEIVTVDGVDCNAGIGDLVLVIQEGGGARRVSRSESNAPIDASVIAVLDSIETEQGSMFL